MIAMTTSSSTSVKPLFFIASGLSLSSETFFCAHLQKIAGEPAINGHETLRRGHRSSCHPPEILLPTESTQKNIYASVRKARKFALLFQATDVIIQSHLKNVKYFRGSSENFNSPSLSHGAKGILGDYPNSFRKIGAWILLWGNISGTIKQKETGLLVHPFHPGKVGECHEKF